MSFQNFLSVIVENCTFLKSPLYSYAIPILKAKELTSPSKVFPGGSVGKESTCQFRRHKRCRFDPWVGKIPWRRKWQPTPVFLPGKSQGQRSLVCYSSWGHKELDMTEVTEHSNIVKSLAGAEGGHKDTSVTLVYLGRPWHHILGKRLPWGTLHRWIIMQSFIIVSERNICINTRKLDLCSVSSTWNSNWSNTYLWPTQHFSTLHTLQESEHSRRHYLVLNPI